MKLNLVKTSDFVFRTKLFRVYDMELPFVEHLEELRQRTFQLIVILINITILVFINVKTLVELLEKPVSVIKFIQLSPGEYLISTIKISVYTSLLICVPLVLSQIICFIFPGLTLKEKKFKLAILSNGTPSLLNELVKSNNLENLFDDLFSIEQVGIYKPDSKVYDMPIKKYQIQKNEVYFLSANTWDVSGGGNYGYNSIWVNRNNNIFDKLDYSPKHQIKQLGELLDIL